MKIDVNTLKKEIDRKRGEISATNQSLGYKSRHNTPKRPFLSGLVEALNTKQVNEEVKVVKAIDNGANRLNPINNIKNHLDAPTQIPQNNQRRQNVNHSNVDDRYDDRFESEFDRELAHLHERYGSRGLVDSVSSYAHQGVPIQPSQLPQTHQPHNGQSRTLDEEMINEIRNTVVDMFFYDKMRKSIKENEDLIREIVIDVIRSLKKKK